MKVYAGFPVRKSGDEYLPASLDLSKILDPILRIGTLPRRRVRHIVIDPGHGGRTAICGEHREKDINLRWPCGWQVAARLKVSHTRSRDGVRHSAARPRLAEKVKADLFISRTAPAAASVSGIEVCRHAAEHLRLAPAKPKAPPVPRKFCKENAYFSFYVQKKLLEKTRATDRGVRRRRFYVIRELSCPGVLIEMGFISNADEWARLLQAAHQSRSPTL